MINISKAEVFGVEPAIRGMRNSWNSWDKSDSNWCYKKSKKESSCKEIFCDDCVNQFYEIGKDDLSLMKKLVKGGSDHSKFMRMIQVWVDIEAPLYFFKQLSTYSVGVTELSTSTMHNITDRPLTIDDFSVEHLEVEGKNILSATIDYINEFQKIYKDNKEYKYCWWQIIQMLPSSYNQLRTINLNYAVLRNIYHSRKNHKLDEWREFCDWLKKLPYSELITEV